jgi:ring-1,2-phenylacetyl-CoA epoxidase subunit PaaD
VVIRRDPRAVVAAVTDPELPVLTIEELGVLGDVTVDDDDAVVVALTPTYSGCPAIGTMRDEVVAALQRAGYANVRVRLELAPAWSSDRITPHGRRKLAAAGIVPPGRARPRPPGAPIPVALSPDVARLRCPRCGAADTEEISRYGSTACKALHRCRACAEPFEHFKAI